MNHQIRNIHYDMIYYRRKPDKINWYVRTTIGLNPTVPSTRQSEDLFRRYNRFICKRFPAPNIQIIYRLMDRYART